MGKLRLTVCLIYMIGCMAFSLRAGVFEGDAIELPDPLDVYVINLKLDNSFPKLVLGNGLATRDALSNYRQALEHFRQDYIEGFARQITANCIHLKKYEAWLNSEAKANRVTRTQYSNDNKVIRLERMECDTRNYDTSSYWQLYDRVLKRYRAADQEAENRVHECFSRNACRQRKR